MAAVVWGAAKEPKRRANMNEMVGEFSFGGDGFRGRKEKVGVLWLVL